jgi:3-dehydroquinate synthase
MTAPSASSPGLPPHRTVRVDLGPRSYDVVIGRGLLDKSTQCLTKAGIKGPIAIITDTTVASLYAKRIENELTEAGIEVLDHHKIQAGESSKSMENLSMLLSELAKDKVPRTGTIIGLGGGVVGDLAGFVAASYLRGIAFVQVPTTLLAMVDSSVGGKTGVNLREGKNLVGAFHQPKLVIADLDTLKSFIGGSREFPAGMAEVIKYGAIKDKALFDRVAKGVKPEDSDLDEIVERCVAIKARIVENDEFETKGERALLNFGHTLGHAIEAATEYKQYLHGEAIALGMRAAAWLSHVELKLPKEEVYALENALKANGLPTQLPENAPWSNSSQLFSFIGRDKKIKDGVFQWVLLDKIGQARSGCATPSNKNQLIEDIIRHLVKPIHTPFPVEGC